MRLVISVWLLGALQVTASTNMGSAYMQGQASVRSAEVSAAARNTAPNSVPGFKTASPTEVSINAHNIGISVTANRTSNPAASYFDAYSATRQSYRLSETDPLLSNANQAIANPQRTLEENFSIEEKQITTSETLEECEEGGSEFLQTCTDNLQVNVHVTSAQRIVTGRTCPGHKKKSWCSGIRFCEGGCQEIYQHIPEVVQVSEGWAEGCHHLEAQVEAGLCSYEGISRDFAQQTRIINGKPITRDHWQKTKTYRCLVNPQNSCDKLLARGCIQVSSTCKETRGGVCVLWRQTYRCQNHATNIKVKRSPAAKKTFCLGGDCQESSYPANTELFEAISQLSVLREAQHGIRDSLDVRVFKGEDRRCTRNCVDFRDCCGNGKGWGVSLHLVHCSAAEKELVQLRQQRKCVNVGTFCANRILGVCITKRTTFCCYGNKLSRILQEQGRRQLGLSWGSPEAPDCNGLTQEQLSRIDLSQIDFSEFYEDVKAQLKVKDKSDGKCTIERLKDNLSHLKPKPTSGLLTAGRGGL